MSTINFSQLRQLAVYVTVIETGSFAAAARQLNTSRSRVSEQVSQLEQVLGVRLLQRSTRQLLVTSEGEDVYRHARQLPDILKNIESVVTPSEPKGRVVITMNHDIAHKFVLPVLENFQSMYPLVNLELKLNDEASDLIADQIDLGIRIGLPKDNSLIGRIMHEESLSIYASPKYVKKNGTPKSIAQLEKCRWIVLPQLDSNNIVHLRRKNGTVELRPTQYYRCNSPLMMQEMTVQGLGISSLLPSAVKAETKSKSLLRLMPSLSSDPLTISLVYPSRQHVPQRTRVLINFLLDAKLFD